MCFKIKVFIKFGFVNYVIVWYYMFFVVGGTYVIYKVFLFEMFNLNLIVKK